MSDDDTPTRRAARPPPTREHAEGAVRDATDRDEAPARRWEPKR